MLKNYSFIPFETSALPKGSVLVFAPHPDDETFGIGGLILRMADNGQRIDIVMMTDGVAGGEADIRKMELLRSADLLGINEVYFFGAEDGKLSIDVTNTKTIINLIETYKPDNVFFPSPLEYHPDHRATAWLVWNALQSITFSGAVFAYEIANQSPSSMLIDISAVMQRKVAAMQVYQSQIQQHSYIETVTAMNRMRAYTLVKEKVLYAEALFKFDHINLDLMSYYYGHFNQYHKGVNTKKLPLVSVLVRTKNRPKYLKNALESIARQTYQQMEVNIVNDGGTGIESIVDSFNFERSFVKNHKRSKGRAAAANALLKMVQGDYCIFLDDDDTFDPEHIENLVSIIEENVSMLVCYSGIRVGNSLEGKSPFNHSYNAALLRKMNYIPFHALLFSRQLIEKGCQFDESLEVYEDWDFWLQLSQHTEFYHHNKITATYNINGRSGAGGAGGQVTKEINLDLWTRKVYEKWQKIWSAKQLQQTFYALEDLGTGEFQEIKKFKQLQKYENSKKAQEKRIADLQKDVERLTTLNKHWVKHIDFLDQERINAYDEGDSGKRNFELASARKYDAQCINLFKEVFKEPMSKAFWNWKYSGVKWRGICAIKNGEVIAHSNGMPRNIMYFGEWKKALQPCDTMVSPKARGGIKKNSPFYTIAKPWVQQNIGINKEFLLVYAFPSRRILSLAEKLGLYKAVDNVIDIRWVINDTLIINRNSVEEYLPNDKLDKAVQKIWRSMAADFKESIIGIRNSQFLKYRYLEHPMFEYKIYIVYSIDKTLQSLFVLKKEGKRMLLMDIIAKKADFDKTIAAALNVVKSSGCNEMKCWITSSKAKLFDHHNATFHQTEIAIPCSNITPDFDPNTVKNKWFLMFGDTDYI